MADRYTGGHRERKKSWGRRSVVAFGSVVLGATLAACGPSGGGEPAPTSSSAETTPGSASSLEATPAPFDKAGSEYPDAKVVEPEQSALYNKLSSEDKSIIDRIHGMTVEEAAKAPTEQQFLYATYMASARDKAVRDLIGRAHIGDINSLGGDGLKGYLPWATKDDTPEQAIGKWSYNIGKLSWTSSVGQNGDGKLNPKVTASMQKSMVLAFGNTLPSTLYKKKVYDSLANTDTYADSNDGFAVIRVLRPPVKIITPDGSISYKDGQYEIPNGILSDGSRGPVTMQYDISLATYPGIDRDGTKKDMPYWVLSGQTDLSKL